MMRHWWLAVLRCFSCSGPRTSRPVRLSCVLCIQSGPGSTAKRPRRTSRFRSMISSSLRMAGSIRATTRRIWLCPVSVKRLRKRRKGPAVFLPERLISARALTGVTQTALAETAGVAQSMVSMVEKHQRDFTEQLAVAFSSALALPLEYFTVTPRSIPRDSLHYRKQSGARVSDTARVHELFSEAFRVTESLLDGSGYPRQQLLAVQDDAELLDVARIDELAQQTREILGIAADAPISNVTRALERAGVAVATMNGHDDGFVKHSGVSWSAGRGEAALIGVMQVRGDRDRFTLAHELGHLVLHSFRRSSDPEREANLFAGAFLIPAPQVREHVAHDATLVDLRRVKATWGLSIQAILMRAQAVEQIDAARSQTLWKQLSARGWRKNEPVEVGAESPRLLFRLLQERYGPSPYSAPEIENEMALPVMMLRSLAPSPSTRKPSSSTPRPVAQLPWAGHG
ncbi:ImmA/IrrE family metallo-endopeptidase [Leucobacter muris]|uniref:ImmA/IrrE family metallo-endopeptidase n=1 Tax=Leucobacter muris TaxID=1935379 RepID=A0ABX5QH37_9MICO|nr:ImmA/IrrE family metallo-endopeptidase [Leucobacter muris]QAB18744.1 ImmA/IrrE family metallo-endopeptidase [Leucobacter muris]